MKRGPRIFYLRGPSQSPPFWLEKELMSILNKIHDQWNRGWWRVFKIPQFTIPLLKDISHDVETNVMSDNILCYQLLYLKNIIHLGQRPLIFWGPRFQPAKPIGKIRHTMHIPRIGYFYLIYHTCSYEKNKSEMLFQIHHIAKRDLVNKRKTKLMFHFSH